MVKYMGKLGILGKRKLKNGRKMRVKMRKEEKVERCRLYSEI